MQLDVREAAQFLNVSDKTIYRWVKRGDLPFFRDRGIIKFHKAEILEWALSHRVNVALDFRGDPDEEFSGEMDLRTALTAGGIHYRIGGDTVPDILRNVTAQLSVLDSTDQDLLLKFLLARESLGSTGIGGGISIPHPRNPVITHISGPIVSLNFLEHPVDYQALDGIPVQVLFLLISPTVKDHLMMLTRITYALRDQRFMKVIMDRENREIILEKAGMMDQILLSQRDNQ